MNELRLPRRDHDKADAPNKNSYDIMKLIKLIIILALSYAVLEVTGLWEPFIEGITSILEFLWNVVVTIILAVMVLIILRNIGRI